MARGDLRIPFDGEPEPADHISKAFAAFGLELKEDLELEEEFYLWPDNIRAFNLWLSIQTQWHTDMGTRTGLIYPGVQVCIENALIPQKERPEYFAAIQSMERAALEEWNQER